VASARPGEPRHADAREKHDHGSPLGRGSLPFLGLPDTVVVNRAGKRFSNEAFYRSIYYEVDAIDGATQTHPNFPCWADFDNQARSKYPFGTAMPGEIRLEHWL
jgi:3-oxosteroid 1-dehydrogenase